MSEKSIQAVVLAAGSSNRFNTGKTKLSYSICGLELIMYPITTLRQLNIPSVLVVGNQRETIFKIIEKYKIEINYAIQEKQLGTGHAVKIAFNQLYAEDILIINGDMPLIKNEIIQELLEVHYKSHAELSFVISSVNKELANGYGRVIKENKKIKIVESRDFVDNNTEFFYINAGIYLVKKKFLDQVLGNLIIHKNSKEYYITDIIEKASNKNKRIKTVEAPFDTIRGVNTLKELAVVEDIKRLEIIEKLMKQGVRFISPINTYVDHNVKIGNNTTIESGVQILQNSSIGANSFIDCYCIIRNSQIAENTTIYPYSIIVDSMIEKSAKMGPFCNIINKSIISNNQIGFAEIARKNFSKAKVKKSETSPSVNKMQNIFTSEKYD